VICGTAWQCSQSAGPMTDRPTAHSGTVNCQYYPIESHPSSRGLDSEHFIMAQAIPDQPTYYSISSGLFPNAFLRIVLLNLREVEAGQLTASFILQEAAPQALMTLRFSILSICRRWKTMLTISSVEWPLKLSAREAHQRSVLRGNQAS
jgi:hypothetical protein